MVRMSRCYPVRGDSERPTNSDRLIEAWVRRELSDAYDRTLAEQLPEELLRLAMTAQPHH
jgi:hypothetical protein